MVEYKDTLNLPKTAFSMKANLAQREPEMIKRWDKLDIYSKLREQRKGKEKYILHDGPPYANGHLHIGHALNKILKDIVVKSQSLNGYDAPYVPGWDCHGLPIELMIEKKHGKVGAKLDAKQFRAKCREYAAGQIDIQREEFKRFGGIGDWDNPYVTMDAKQEADIIRSIGKILAKGYIKPGHKPVNWCMACSSSLAEAEVEYKDKVSPSIDVGFKVLDQDNLLKKFKIDALDGDVHVVIWTTTPWTLPANQAVSLHSELEYALVKTKDNHIVIASDLVESALQRFGIEDYCVLANCKGRDLEGFKLQHPLYDKKVPVVLGEHVNLEAGTGCVHTAPAHGADDYVIGKKYQLEVYNPVLDSGVYRDDTPLVAGLFVLKANDHIIDILKENKVLFSSGTVEHSYPHCWRHKTPIIFRTTPQWFVDMNHNDFHEHALKAIKEVDWHPEQGEKRLSTMIANRPDWCISRQRSWGTPLPLIVHEQTGELHPDMPELIEEIAKRVEQSNMEAWFDLDLQELIGDDAKDYRKITDVLDVWLDSGVTHTCVLKERPELQWPADIYLEGSDQHRGWFQSSLLTSVAMYDQAPFKNVLTHGFVVDANGHKMSKSLGNVVAPDKVMKTLGADIMRLWVAATDSSGEVTVSDEILKRVTDAYRRIRNTARFFLSNLFDFDPAKDCLPANDLLALDAWAIKATQELQQEIIKDYDSFQFHVIYQKIHNFCSHTMGSFYLDILKDRLYTCKADGKARRSAQTAMYHILEALVRWLMPILSFTADEIWQHMPGERSESVLLSTWYDGFPAVNDKEINAPQFWNVVATVRDEVNKQIEIKRAAGEIGSALEAEVTLYCDADLSAQLNSIATELRFALITSDAYIKPMVDADASAAETAMSNLKVAVISSQHKKCGRCWQQRDDVGVDGQHEELCQRCVENAFNGGEERVYA